MEIENGDGERIQIPTAERLKKIAGISGSDFDKEIPLGGYSNTTNVFNLNPNTRTVAEKVSDETEAFIDCVKRLRGELGVDTERATVIALTLVMIDRR